MIVANFLNRRMSTFTGTVVLLLMVTFIGVLFVQRLNKIIEIRYEAIERHSGIKLR